jgi:hypothetical protein
MAMGNLKLCRLSLSLLLKGFGYVIVKPDSTKLHQLDRHNCCSSFFSTGTAATFIRPERVRRETDCIDNDLSSLPCFLCLS